MNRDDARDGDGASESIVAREPSAHWEAEYNPRVRVPDAPRYFADWAARGEVARARLPGTCDLPYGSDPREKLDLFRPATRRGTLVYLHGGYWRAFGRETHAWVAEAFIQNGITVAVPSYPLAPAASLPGIIRSVSTAIRYLTREVLDAQERSRLILVGHSAGAHLAACLLADQERGTPDLVSGIVCISGIFDLLPLLHTQMLSAMGWTAASLHAASPLFMPVPDRGTVLLAVGADESAEFRTQTQRLAHAWSDRVAGVSYLEGRDHFSVIDALHRTEYPLTRSIIELFAASPAT